MLVKLSSAFLFSALSVLPAMSETLWSVDQLEQPESAIYDPVTEQVIVSNISGGPIEVNGKGFLSLIKMNGDVVDLKWVEDLNAPKGMAIVDRKLFVSDITKLHIIDLDSGEIVQSLSAEGAMFLNDVAASDSSVWVSDMMTHTIWQYQNGAFEKFIEDAFLEHPNGLLFDNDSLIVGSWGAGLQKDFSTTTPGSLLSIDLETKVISNIKGAENLGNLDGVVRVEDTLIVSDWIAGKVFAYHDGETKLVGEYPQGLADIAAVGTTVFMPYMMNNKLDAFDAKTWMK